MAKTPTTIDTVSLPEIIDRYRVLLLDSYGVLVNHSGALPGAQQLVSELNSASREYKILTNDASRNPQTAVEKYHSLGLDIDISRIVSSGMLITDYIYENNLVGAPALLFGPASSAEFLLAADCQLLPLSISSKPVIIAITDDDQQPFLESINTLLSLVLKLLSEGHEFHLLEANPDIIYPTGEQTFSIAAGAIAQFIIQAVNARFPHGSNLKHVQLGKPHNPIFARALRGLEGSKTLMIGDQILTDIKGANDSGLDSALMITGVTDVTKLDPNHQICPNYLLSSLV